MYKIVLLRHGESTWNQENRFTGWTDVDLSDRGRQEAAEARTGRKFDLFLGAELGQNRIIFLVRGFDAFGQDVGVQQPGRARYYEKSRPAVRSRKSSNSPSIVSIGSTR